MRRTWLVAPAVGLILLLAPSALAKGGGLKLDEQVERYEVLSAEEVFWARTKLGVRHYLRGGPYFAYLSPKVPGARLRQPPPLPEGGTLLGAIVIGDYEKQGRWWSVTFGIHFRMPDVRLGSYRIDICTNPCKRTIEELEPTVIRVVSGPLEERVDESISGSIAAATGGVSRAMYAMDKRLERRATRTLSGLRDYTRVRIDAQSDRIDELTSTIAEARRAAAHEPFPTGVAAFAFAIGALLASAGWFFSPKVAHRATLSKKKKTSALGGAA
jgi:hypothetical protein